MRSSLKGRLDELNRLLIVSQGVASTLDIREAMQPVLESALVTGATSARVVLESSVLPDFDGSSSASLRMGSGPSTELFSALDDQVVALTRKQDQMKITNLTRPRLFTVSNGTQLPHALLALALRNEDLYFGAFWVAYSQSHIFKEEEIRYLSTLASQAVIATANTRLFMTSELGRQRLEAILVSTPDAVLVTDRNDRLLLINPATSKILGDLVKQGVGKPISSLELPTQLVNLLHDTSNEKQSLELVLTNGRIYLANASSIVASEKQVGRVCILRDITHFRELDTLKSDFVSTVSHDLRSPLTLIRGYTTMLQMVGELNDQQRGYLNKIMIGVDNMSRLVNNLLDFGRIEAGVGLQLEKKPVDEVVSNVVGLLQLQANQKQIQLTKEIPDQELPLVEADQALLQQALYNLVENAIK
jgi:PAS domain S-box-containing protein